VTAFAARRDAGGWLNDWFSAMHGR
jgi:hypothetical protein